MVTIFHFYFIIPRYNTHLYTPRGFQWLIHSTHNQGFTLVELAIALMVIGLLIGGVLKGQELIENAKITSTTKQISDLRTAIIIFSSTYNALPGDIKRPNRIPNCTESPCSDNGNGDHIINPSLTSATSGASMSETISTEYGSRPERKNFFRHLSYAGLLQTINPPNDIPTLENWQQYYPTTPYSDSVLIAVHLNLNTGFNQNTIYIKSANSTDAPLPTFAAAAIDQKLDNGKPWSGNIITLRNGPSNTSSCIITDETTGERLYAEQIHSPSCALAVGLAP